MKIFLASVLAAFLFITNTASAEVKVNRPELIQRALAVQKNSYAPYSNFKVAAAVLCSSGKIYTGVNVENSDYTAGMCAIRNAIFHAIAEGERQICAVATVGGANGVITDYCPPGGTCRQIMREFANPKKLLIIMAKSPTDYVEKTLEELLPMSFGPDNLK
ncbi:MAG: cytidine deaminase [Selenomonadaceae bacterium]|nr:cytidine deaminase [Selenomonadaceae bacterium]